MIYKSLLKGTFNTRELGGFVTPCGETKRDMIWRSDRLSEYDADDEKTLLERNITTIIDMRTDEEAEKYPCVYDKDGFDYRRFAITEGSMPPGTLEEVPVSYMSIALSESMGKVLGAVSGAKGGAVFFCTAGKDRTGVAAALILSACDAMRQDIIDDYVLSREYNRERLEKFLAEHPGTDRNVVLANEKSMDGFLTMLYERFGSIGGYFDYMGLADCIGGIRKKLAGQWEDNG